jgi:Putative Ig domain
VYRKELYEARRNALILPIIFISLSGCLEQEKSEAGFYDPSGPSDPSGNIAPWIGGYPDRAIIVGNRYEFTPDASDADGDKLTFSIDNKPSWAGFDEVSGELSGQPTLGNVGMFSNIKISVSDGSASDSLPNFSISVDQMGNISTTLSWTPPTENEDGSALMDLAGYKIYWGTTPGDYTDSVKINNAGVSSYVVSNLSPGTYEFVATSFNADGIESAYSNPATRVLN